MGKPARSSISRMIHRDALRTSATLQRRWVGSVPLPHAADSIRSLFNARLPAIRSGRLLTDHPMTAAGPSSSRVRWRIITLLALAGFVAYLLRTNMSVAGEGMVRDLGLSQVQLGVVLAAF